MAVVMAYVIWCPALAPILLTTIFFYCHATFESLCYNCQHINVSYWHCTYKKFFLLARNRLRALIVLIFAHDMQIQVAHALRKQGYRLISYTANIHLVTIAACYNCPRSPSASLLILAKVMCMPLNDNISNYNLGRLNYRTLKYAASFKV